MVAGQPTMGAGEEIAGGRAVGSGRNTIKGRSTIRDGWVNRAESYVTTHFASFWRLIQLVLPLRRLINRVLINRAILRMPTRPNPLSTMAPYTSWHSLTNRTFDGRHLPPAHTAQEHPDLDRTADTLHPPRRYDPLSEVNGSLRLLRTMVHRRLPAQ